MGRRSVLSCLLVHPSMGRAISLTKQCSFLPYFHCLHRVGQRDRFRRVAARSSVHRYLRSLCGPRSAASAAPNPTRVAVTARAPSTRRPTSKRHPRARRTEPRGTCRQAQPRSQRSCRRAFYVRGTAKFVELLHDRKGDGSPCLGIDFLRLQGALGHHAIECGITGWVSQLSHLIKVHKKTRVYTLPGRPVWKSLAFALQNCSH
jgi:hypothetical protein